MFPFHRPPATPEGQKLYYRQKPIYDPNRFNPRMAHNILIQFRLYRWAFQGYNEVQRAYLMETLFPDVPIRALRVGRLLKAILPYYCGSTKHGELKWYWRFIDSADLQYGLEYLMLTWLTDPRLVGKIPLIPEPIEDQEGFEQVLQRIKRQTNKEDLLMLDTIQPRWDQPRKGHGVHLNKDCLLR